MSKADRDPLIHGLAEGREHAFVELYDRFGRSLFQVAFALLQSREDAEDAVQDVFVRLAQTRQRLLGVENLRAYLFASLRHAAFKLATARKRNHLAMSRDQNQKLADKPATAEFGCSERLEKALAGLPREQRELLALKLDAGLTFAEIASLLGISANTAASRYRYGLEKLRATFEK
jgi:RNA polymerase sigma-70 factor (ECF subfamily)